MYLFELWFYREVYSKPLSLLYLLYKKYICNCVDINSSFTHWKISNPQFFISLLPCTPLASGWGTNPSSPSPNRPKSSWGSSRPGLACGKCSTACWWWRGLPSWRPLRRIWPWGRLPPPSHCRRRGRNQYGDSRCRWRIWPLPPPHQVLTKTIDRKWRREEEDILNYIFPLYFVIDDFISIKRNWSEWIWLESGNFNGTLMLNVDKN